MREGTLYIRKRMMNWWCFTSFVQLLGMEVWCTFIMIMYSHTGNFDTDCTLAVVFLALTPVWIATLVIPVFVYLDLEEEVIEIQNLETRPVERSPRRQNETQPHRAPQLQTLQTAATASATTSSIASNGSFL